MFDVVRFFYDYSIDVSYEGKSVTAGWINCQCPFCDDHSDHLGFNIRKNYFNCWKCGYHSIFDVIKKFTNDNPKEIIKKYDIKYRVIKKDKIIDTKHEIKKIKLPGGDLSINHKKYLTLRGFDPEMLIEKYKLQGTNNIGNYCQRIIIPIFYKKKIVSFQGRDITGINKLRYKACNKQNEIIHHKHILYNLDNCKNNFVIVVEGVFDVFRFGDNCCCTFGKSYTKKQLLLLQKYNHIFILFDNDMAGQKASKKLANDLQAFPNINIYNITCNSDPGDMTQTEAQKILNEIKLFLF